MIVRNQVGEFMPKRFCESANKTTKQPLKMNIPLL